MTVAARSVGYCDQYKGCKPEKTPVVAKLLLSSKMYRLAMGTVATVVKRSGVTMDTLGSKLIIN